MPRLQTCACAYPLGLQATSARSSLTQGTRRCPQDELEADAGAAKLDPEALREAARSREVKRRVAASQDSGSLPLASQGEGSAEVLALLSRSASASEPQAAKAPAARPVLAPRPFKFSMFGKAAGGGEAGGDAAAPSFIGRQAAPLAARWAGRAPGRPFVVSVRCCLARTLTASRICSITVPAQRLTAISPPPRSTSNMGSHHGRSFIFGVETSNHSNGPKAAAAAAASADAVDTAVAAAGAGGAPAGKQPTTFAGLRSIINTEPQPPAAAGHGSRGSTLFGALLQRSGSAPEAKKDKERVLKAAAKVLPLAPSFAGRR